MSAAMRFVAAAVVAVALVIAATPASAAEKVRKVRVEGNQRIEYETIMSYVSVQPGDPFNPIVLDRALKTLYGTGLFADVSLYQEGRDLIVVVVENPIINEIAFEGNKRIKDDALLAEIKLRPRTVFTRTRVRDDVERLEEMYRLSGRFSATVDPKIIKLDQNRVNLVFEISEGPVTHISRISFIGNKKYDDGQLQRVIRSKEDRWWRFWTSDDKYDPDRAAYDRELLRKFYLDRGYADFQVDFAVAELSPDRKNFLVTFTLSEGPRYRIGNIHIHSNIPGLDAAPFKEAITFEPGGWYKASEIENTIVKLTDALANHQYAFVDVVPGVTRNRELKTVDVRFDINEGQKVFVDNINISGNVRTLDEVIRREMKLVEGDPFNGAQLKKSEQNIKDLGFFERVQMRPVPGATPDKTNIEIEVSEKSTGELSLGAGYSTSDGILGDFSIRERNFLGKGQELGLAATISGKRTEFDFSFTEPYFLKRDLSTGLDLFHITRDLQSESSYDSRRTGGAVRLGYPLGDKLRQNLSYRYEDNEILNVQATASAFIQQQAGERVTSAVTSILTYDDTDSKLEPTEGLVVRLTNELAGLGGDARYVLNKVGGTYYIPVYEKWVLSQMGEAGNVFGWGGESARINERFYIGGATLRGFKDAGIGPRDTATGDALGGTNFWRGSTQLDFPSGLPEDMGVRAHVFSDYGSLWNLAQNGPTIADDSSIRVSVGAGISWYSPMGPLTLDFSQPLVKEEYDRKEFFRFSFGTRF
ncbi:MAG: outer membrane protein assembly factor BamA [Alphaproteobacteria bacterium]|nr:outer membrane protein assembly factor BamA [Alphaproteobacteria bacterium]